MVRKSDVCCWYRRCRRLRFRGTHRVVHVFLFLKRSGKRKSVDVRHFIRAHKTHTKHGLKINAIHGRRRGHETRLDEHRFVQTDVRGCVFVVVRDVVVVVVSVRRGKEKVFRFCLPDTRDRPLRTPNEKRRFARRIRRQPVSYTHLTLPTILLV